MITMSTEELVGMINDVLPFATKNPDDGEAYNIRLEVRDEEVTFSATNRVSAARVFWTPDYEIHDNDEDGVYTAEYGVFEFPEFSVRLSIRDAKSIASAFKLPTKLDFAPVSISVELASVLDNLYKVKVMRRPSLAWTALTIHAAADGRPLPREDGRDNGEMNVHEMIRKVRPSSGADVVASARTAFKPESLVPFSKVTRHGALRFWHTSTDDGSPLYVESSERFTGMVYQTRVDKE